MGEQWPQEEGRGEHARERGRQQRGTARLKRAPESLISLLVQQLSVTETCYACESADLSSSSRPRTGPVGLAMSSGPSTWRQVFATWPARQPLLTAILWVLEAPLLRLPMPVCTLVLTAFIVPVPAYGLVPRLLRLLAWVAPSDPGARAVASTLTASRPRTPSSPRAQTPGA